MMATSASILKSSSYQPSSSPSGPEAANYPSGYSAPQSMTPNAAGNDQAAKIAIGVAVPAAVITVPLVVIALAYLIVIRDAKLRRKREQKKAIEDKEQDPWTVEAQPYLQAKGELATTGQERHELHAERTNHELQADMGRYELSGENARPPELSTTKDQYRISILRGCQIGDEECIPKPGSPGQ